MSRTGLKIDTVVKESQELLAKAMAINDNPTNVDWEGMAKLGFRIANFSNKQTKPIVVAPVEANTAQTTPSVEPVQQLLVNTPELATATV